MKKICSWATGIIILCLFSECVFSQTETDTTFSNQMNYIFANLDKTKTPYGILRDYGMEFTNIENYNGTVALADSNYADANAFWDVYQTLLTSRFSTSATGFAPADTVDNRWYNQRQPGKIVLSGLYFNYSRFKDNAANNYVTITNNRLYDKYVGGVYQNPYQSEQVFLLSPPVNFYQGKSLQIVLPANLWYTNNAAGITSLQLDAGDGVGYRTLTVGQTLTINYADTGHKEWTYKLTISGGAILYSHSQMLVQTDYSGGTFSRVASEVIPPSPFTATKQYLGIAGQGYVTIQYANVDHILRKPLIVAEGFDPGKILTPENKFGINSINDFISSVNDINASPTLKQLLLTNPQYDIIYVDWKNGTDYLQRNAYLLETIIQWVNANKQPLAGVVQPNVVLGQSMGGVIARYALKDMENTALNHNTRLYISDDAPHQGANVPEGYQHLARHARSLYIRTGFTAVVVEVIQLIRGGVSPLAALSLADQPAAKQMLINFVNGSNTIDNTVHNAWETELKNIGYPNGFTGTPFRKVAVSNGSECANPQPFSAGANLLTYTGKGNTKFLGDIAGTLAFPAAGILLGQPALLLGIFPGRNDFSFDFAVNAQADGISNQVYRGKITYKKTILYLVPVTVNITNKSYNSSASTLPYDYFPGGYYALQLNLNSSSNQNIFFKYSITASNQPTFNFVPTASALDIGSNNVTLTKADYLTRYIGALPPAAPKNTPFQNFITAFNDSRINEQHISIERRNGDWIAAELNAQMPAANCSASCDISTINGDASFCTVSNPFTIPNLPAGSTVTWSASPNLVQFSCNPCISPTLTKTGNGTITLTASIVNSCGNIIISKPNINIGTAVVSISYSTSGCNGSYQTWSLVASSPNTVSSWLWTVDPPMSGSWYIYNPNSSTTLVDVSTGGGISVTATNNCGTAKTGVTIYNNNCHSLVASPNPSTDNVDISLAQPNDLNSANKITEKIYGMKITDQVGNVKKQFQYSAGVKKVRISLNGLSKGAYIIQAFNGKLWVSTKIIKQ